jgi:oligopeptide/dipeptide ABC transporter ATP-binding protein
VSVTIDGGQSRGVLGESGCGKSVTAMSILQLIPQPPGKIVGGEIRFKGENLAAMDAKGLQRIRGNEISVIFQEPMTSLNPVFTVGDQSTEALLLHQSVSEDQAWEIALEMLVAVGIPAPESRIDEYPHQMSGGMKQRVMIAMALACQPDLLIADEPTTALDVTIQAQILELLKKMQHDRGMAIMLITHDLGVVAETCDSVVVLYAGRVAETAPTVELFETPTHPYTAGLLQALPDRAKPGARLYTIEGMVPSPLNFPTGCRFRSRCPKATEQCSEKPPLIQVSPTHQAWCWHPLTDEERAELREFGA